MMCSVDGCSNNTYCKGLCSKHYWKQYRNIKNNRTRTRFDRNQIILKDTYAEVLLYDRKEIIVGAVKIDIEDVKQIKKYKMCLMHKYVAIRVSPKKKIMLSNFLYNKEIPQGYCLSYKNGDTMDNRKENLILKNKSTLNRNKKIFKNNTSGNRGVYKLKNSDYTAAIANRYIGYFKNKKDAVSARTSAEDQLGWNKE